jgi:hypothetical protein
LPKLALAKSKGISSTLALKTFSPLATSSGTACV